MDAGPVELVRLLGGRIGHFRFESGHHGELWLELDRLFVRPRLVEPYAAELAAQLAPYEPAAVCGPLVGGAFLAQQVAVRLDVDCYYTERVVSGPGRGGAGAARAAGGGGGVRYELPLAFAGTAAGQRVAVVDDAINAGSAVRQIIAALRGCGAEPVAVGALVVLGSIATELAAQEHVAVERLASLQSGLWPPALCPLCAAGRPVEDLVR